MLPIRTSCNLSKKNLLLTFLFCLLGLCAPSVNAGQGSLTLGIHPYRSVTDLYKRFTPLADYLGKKVGQPVTIKIARDYHEHIDQVSKDKVDIAFIGPVPYVTMVDIGGKKPILARLEIDGKATLQGVIIVAKESPLRVLKDLTGKHFAFVDPHSTTGHLVPRFMLWEAGVRVDKMTGYSFLRNHDNVALGVLVGDYDAGAVQKEVFHKYERRGLKSLATTPPISGHLFVASSELRPKTVQALRKALYHLKHDEQGRTIMSAIKNNMTGMVPADDHDYDNLRTMLQVLKKLGVQTCIRPPR